MDHGNEYRLTGWLAQQEDNYRLIIYQCDYNYSLWTQRCVRQADCVLIVALGDKTPVVGKVRTVFGISFLTNDKYLTFFLSLLVLNS